MKVSKFIVVLLLNGLTIGLYAQKPTELQDEEKTFENSFNAQLSSTNKVNSKPELPVFEPDESSKNLTYSMPQHLLKVEYPAPLIKPVAMLKPAKNETYGLYTKLGFGFPITPLAEISLHNTQNDKWSFGATFRHHSAYSQKPIENQQFSKNDAHVMGRYYLNDRLAVGGNLGYSNYSHLLYGYPQPQLSFPDKDSVRQRFVKIHASADLNNPTNDKSPISYAFKVMYYNLSDRFKASENHIGGDLNLDYKIAEKYPIKLRVQADNYSYTSEGNTSAKLFVPKGNLNFIYGKDLLRLKVGAFAGSDNGKFFVCPDVEVAFKFANGQFVPFLGWTGDIVTNSLDLLRQYNPFINTNIPYFNTRQQTRYIGIHGELAKFTFEGKVAHRPNSVLPLFLNDYSGKGNQFKVKYDSCDMVTIGGTIQWSINDKLKFTALANYHLYNPSAAGQKAWHLPNLEANTSLEYQALKALKLKAQFNTISGVNYLDETNNTQTIAPMIDLNLGATYRINENFSGFIDVNNLLNNRNQRFYRYPQLGINFMVGVVYKM